ncbi:gliding motility protein GldL [Hallella sp.]|uniref:type IX secretion system motor protein PorL/GldL n=1 Tax=Hallella sp. TaxID=2980186 RepID=UPI003078C3D0
MANHSKYNLVYRLQKWIDTVDGQTFLNYAYSWGASVVILGALFKLTHLPLANIMLFIGMGTEVFVFFISAFDRPFDKTADGRDLPTHMTEEYLASGKVTYSRGEQQAAEELAEEQSRMGGAAVAGAQGGSTVIFAGGSASQSSQAATASVAGQPLDEEQLQAVQAAAAGVAGATVVGTPNYVPQMSAEDAEKLNEAQSSYVDELKELVETLKKVNEQSARLTRDSEEMENLNRTLTGISRVYEMQLKGASQQIGTIDQINDQTRRMAQQIEQLNQIYARMIEAMTVNMRAAAPGASVAGASSSVSSPSSQL